MRASYVRCLEALVAQGAYVGIATHDEYLIGEALRIVARRGLAPDGTSSRCCSACGRSAADELVAAGHRLRVYVPYGTHWYEYSVRRLQENPKIAGLRRRATWLRARFAARTAAGSARRSPRRSDASGRRGGGASTYVRRRYAGRGATRARRSTTAPITPTTNRIQPTVLTSTGPGSRGGLPARGSVRRRDQEADDKSQQRDHYPRTRLAPLSGADEERETAVDDDRLAADHVGVLRAEERDRAGDVVRA